MEIMDNNYAERLDAIAVDSHTNAINNNLTNKCFFIIKIIINSYSFIYAVMLYLLILSIL